MAIRSTRSLGVNLLGVWLLLTGLFYFVHIVLPGLGMLMALLALVAGLLILLGR